MTSQYLPSQIERKWQERWTADGLYRVTEDPARPKYYALTMFPYTSGDLHIGHWYAMAPSDTQARFKRMQGFNVLHPMGFDAFGLPAENAAIKHGIHPFKWTMDNVENMRRQLRTMGTIYDWDREVVTCLPDYYRWTQWFFLQLCKKDLAYRAKASVSWCPHCQTVLANEQVTGEGTCERCETAVQKQEREQWFYRTTSYADELLNFEGVDWPDRIKTMQTNWIGKSTGARISFELEDTLGSTTEISVFTTRPDTVFGVTFFVLAPEHPLVPLLTASDRHEEVHAYIDQARERTEIERSAEEREKTGVFLGTYIKNRLNGERVPLWIADYVLPTYGTGAVMAVPAHDQRDFDFATRYGLPIKVVIAPPDWDGKPLPAAYVGPGTMVNSGRFSGLASDGGGEAVCAYLESTECGGEATSYRMRDWLVSRQRYWGTPIPIIYCDKCGAVPVPEKDLPVVLPLDAQFRPTGESPLKYHPSFVNTTCPQCAGPAHRETDTLDTHTCSAWYWLRYISPGHTEKPFDASKRDYWLPVDLYTGGAEHATLHLLYARFFTRAIRDIGLVSFSEPFTRLFNQGVIRYQHEKMSKSKGNVVNPDRYVAELGADTVRAYLMFVGPWEQGGEWNDSGIIGINRWLHRVWNLVETPYETRTPGAEADAALRKLTHQTIKKVTLDLDRFHFNTMLAALMEFTNYLADARQAGSLTEGLWREAISALLKLLAPSVPHLAEELWTRTGGAYSIHSQPWPAWDEAAAKEDEFTLVLQVNGKVRDRITAPVSITSDRAIQLALEQERIKAYLDNKKVLKTIYVPGRLVNIVVG